MACSDGDGPGEVGLRLRVDPQPLSLIQTLKHFFIPKGTEKIIEIMSRKFTLNKVLLLFLCLSHTDHIRRLGKL